MTRCFFITGLGRSGTQWLYTLLGQVKGLSVQHEWWQPNCYFALAPMHRDAVGLPRLEGEEGRDYWVRERLAATQEKMIQAGQDVYGEINSKARFFLPSLKERFNPVLTLQLVRDGRDVVRSYHARQKYTGHDLHPPLEPGPDDPLYRKWHTLDRFQKLCWMWGFTAQWVDKNTDTYIRFEDLLSSRGWDVLRYRLLLPMDIDLDLTTWQHHREQHIDASRQPFHLPHWKEWEPWQTEWFWGLCGDIMRTFGYEA